MIPFRLRNMLLGISIVSLELQLILQGIQHRLECIISMDSDNLESTALVHLKQLGELVLVFLGLLGRNPLTRSVSDPTGDRS